jgi:hypothetical protein
MPVAKWCEGAALMFRSWSLPTRERHWDEHRHQRPTSHLPNTKITNMRTSGVHKPRFVAVPASTITESICRLISSTYKCLPCWQLPALAVRTHCRRLDRNSDSTVEPCIVISDCSAQFYVTNCTTVFAQHCTIMCDRLSSDIPTAILTLGLLMSYIYGNPCKARNFNVV